MADTNLAAGAYTYVFASTKDRRIPGRVLHTNFRLSGTGEYLGLVRPDGTNNASEYAPVFPTQYADVSYGLQQNAATFTLVVWEPSWLQQQLIRTGRIDGPLSGLLTSELLQAAREVAPQLGLPSSTAPASNSSVTLLRR